MARKKNDEIHVHVASYGEGRALMLRYRCPKTGKTFTRSSGTTNRKAAGKEAGKWEEDLRSGKYKPASKITWEEFRNRYESEYVVVELKEQSGRLIASVFDAVERLLKPHLLSEIDGEAIDRWKILLREERRERRKGDAVVIKVIKRTEETISGNLRILKAALNWGASKKRRLLVEAPEIEISQASGSKGRPLCQEEFERILSKIEAKRRADDGAIWSSFLSGLWWSGLRIEEAINLTWDDPRKPHVDLNGERSTITIPGECQKSGKDTVGPIVPEFYNLLAKIPEAERTGYVFDLPFRRCDSVSKIVSAFGKAAGVKVSATKFASAHDFRRSFGQRWAMRVMPAVLQKLMRHASISTTMKYYATGLVQEESKLVWQAFRATQPAPSTEEAKEATI